MKHLYFQLKNNKMQKSGPTDSQWQKRIMEYASGDYDFRTGQYPAKGSKWGKAKNAIDICPMKTPGNMRDLFGNKLKCTCGYHNNVPAAPVYKRRFWHTTTITNNFQSHSDDNSRCNSSSSTTDQPVLSSAAVNEPGFLPAATSTSVVRSQQHSTVTKSHGSAVTKSHGSECNLHQQAPSPTTSTSVVKSPQKSTVTTCLTPIKTPPSSPQVIETHDSGPLSALRSSPLQTTPPPPSPTRSRQTFDFANRLPKG